MTLGLLHQTLKAIRVAIHKLKVQGFADVVIATDHRSSPQVYLPASASGPWRHDVQP
jgi:hypothetical protein